MPCASWASGSRRSPQAKHRAAKARPCRPEPTRCAIAAHSTAPRPQRARCCAVPRPATRCSIACPDCPAPPTCSSIWTCPPMALRRSARLPRRRPRPSSSPGPGRGRRAIGAGTRGGGGAHRARPARQRAGRSFCVEAGTAGPSAVTGAGACGRLRRHQHRLVDAGRSAGPAGGGAGAGQPNPLRRRRRHRKRQNRRRWKPSRSRSSAICASAFRCSTST